eukprot:SAG22_NODE_2061_length_3062_cov_69.961721_2_plen_810_part_01
MMHKFMYVWGILPKDNFVEKNGLELMGQYVGSTTPLVKEAVQDAIGGCLFLDEAYALASQEEGRRGAASSSFASEAIRTLLTEVENNRSRVMVVLAGYHDKMKRLLAADPGFPRRFPLRLHLEDYSAADLVQIAEKTAMDRFGMTFAQGLDEQLEEYIDNEYSSEIKDHNGGLAVNLVDAAVGRLATRIVDSGDPGVDSSVLVPQDFAIDEKKQDILEEERKEVEATVQGLTGMREAKEMFDQIKQRVMFVQDGGNPKILEVCLNMVITGSPGTGKTTFSRIIFKFLHAWGVLPKDRFVEKNGLELKGQYVGQTTPKVKEAIADAMGGCLFLDEAYALGGTEQGVDSFASDAIRTLLTEVENNRTNVLVVLAGYRDKMTRLLNADPGLPRRFPLQLHLSDYSPEELGEIAEQAALDRFEMRLAPGLKQLIVSHIKRERMQDIAKNNAALSINMVETAMGQLATRIMRQRRLSPDLEVEMDVLVAEDFDINANTLGGVGTSRPAEPGLKTSAGTAGAARPPAPAAASAGWLSMFGTELVSRTPGRPITVASLASKKYVGVYFSAHWCPPCRSFTPTLSSWYQQHASRLGMEIVFVSSDQHEGAFNQYLALMPWAAVPFSDEAGRRALSDRFGCTGLPFLVILDEQGAVCTTEGRSMVMSDPQATAFPWATPSASPSFHPDGGRMPGGMTTRQVRASTLGGRSLIAEVSSNGDFKSPFHLEGLKREFAAKLGVAPREVEIEVLDKPASSGNKFQEGQTIVMEEVCADGTTSGETSTGTGSAGSKAEYASEPVQPDNVNASGSIDEIYDFEFP